MRARLGARPQSRLPKEKTSLQKTILFIDNKLTPLFFPSPLLWNMKIMLCVSIPYVLLTQPIIPRITPIIEYALVLNDYYLGTGPDSGNDLQISVMGEIMAVVIPISMYILVIELKDLTIFMLNGLVTNFVWWVKVVLHQKLLEYTGIQDYDTYKEKREYKIDTTQKHYPRKRQRLSVLYFTGLPSKGLLASLFLSDDHHSNNPVEEGGDIPDVEELPGNHCICSYVMRLQPQDAFYSFVVYFCECREDDAFYEVCSAFDVPESIRVKIATNSSSMIIRCFDALHWVYHRDNELTLTTVKTKLSEYSDELRQIVSDYHVNE